MNKLSYGSIILVILFVFLAPVGFAQTDADVSDPTVPAIPDAANLKKPLGREKPATTEPNLESSSFVGDADNLDPLRVNSENLKEDDEPVLEAIKQIPTAKPASTDQEKADMAEKKKIEAELATNSDDPDLKLEKRLYQIYRKYNRNPTPENVWAKASSSQESREYIVQKGDTLWSISNVLFGDPNFWPKLWSLNKQGILNPHFIEPGMVIYFYSGDEDYSPTLSTLKEDGDDGMSVVRANSHLNERVHIVRDPKDKPTPIPNSLPLSKNSKYFIEEPPKREVSIGLMSLPEFPLEINNDIFLTDKLLVSDVKVDLSEVAKFRCYDGRLLKGVQFRKKIVEEYDVLEPLEKVQTKTGLLYTYKTFGVAVPYQDSFLKLIDCKSLMATNLVFLPKDLIRSLVTRRRTPSQKVSLIGGPDIVTQKFFIRNQIAYVDFGSRPFNTGDEYETQSQITDNINGKIKVIEKYGSFGVVMILDMDDVIEVGDQVIFN